jgi:hypothetical protein
MDGDSIYADFPACRRDPHELSLVGTGNGPAGNDLISLRDNVFDLEMQIRETGDKEQDLLFVGVRADRRTHKIGPGEGMAGKNELIHYLESPLVPHFFIETPNGVLVIG